MLGSFYVLQEGVAVGFLWSPGKVIRDRGPFQSVDSGGNAAIISQRGGSPTSEMAQADGIFSGRYSAATRDREDVASDACAVAGSTILD